MEDINETSVDLQNKTSAQHEEIIKKTHYQKQKITILRKPLDATSLIIPKISRLPARQLELTDTRNTIKAPIYHAIVAAYNHAFFNETAASTAKDCYSRTIPNFVDWLNTKKVDNKYLLLKEYETYWFDVRENHGAPSPLIRLNIILFYYAYEENYFLQYLNADDASFLRTLSATKMSLQTRKKQESLQSYFGSIAWLRYEDVGIGTDLYRVLASPKLTISSLKALVSTIILELLEAKIALRIFLSSHPAACESLSYAINQSKDTTRTFFERNVFLGKTFYDLFLSFHEITTPPENLIKAIKLLAVSSLTTLGMKNYQEIIGSRESFHGIFHCKSNKDTESAKLYSNNLAMFFSWLLTGDSPMFSLTMLIQLSDNKAPFPITKVEKLMFTWLMASLTVQPHDIKKLSKNDFRLIRKGQRVTDIECEYFKGRANTIHTTRSLSVRKNEGKALLAYLNQHPENEIQTFDIQKPSITSGNQSVLGSLSNTISIDYIYKELQIVHQKEGDAPMVMPKVIQALAQNGVTTYKPKGLSREDLLKARTFCKGYIFGLQAIKNSAVHAYSDPYTLQYMMNRNSHSNQTEKIHYLNQDNEAWINASGLITRSVMFDLINNVFALDFSSEKDDEEIKNEVANFNFEFESVCEVITYKSEEMLSRLKVITQQKLGRINEVGVISYSTNSTMKYAPIYVLDSPVTVCKMRNYLFMFKKDYKKLLIQNPDFFYQTVLPTVEWMEQVLSTKLSVKSIIKGGEMFEQMKNLGVSAKVFHSI